MLRQFGYTDFREKTFHGAASDGMMEKKFMHGACRDFFIVFKTP
jgi:hypothetical protein